MANSIKGKESPKSKTVPPPKKKGTRKPSSKSLSGRTTRVRQPQKKKKLTAAEELKLASIRRELSVLYSQEIERMVRDVEIAGFETLQAFYEHVESFHRKHKL